MNVFREDVAELVPHLRAFARSLTRGDVHLADDIVQDTFVRASERMDTLRSASHVRPWLVTIAIRLTHSRLTRARRRFALLEDGVVDVGVAVVSDTGADHALEEAAQKPDEDARQHEDRQRNAQTCPQPMTQLVSPRSGGRLWREEQ